MKLLIIGTHPDNANGYSKVVHSLSKNLKEVGGDDIDITIFGVQRRNHVNNNIVRKSLKDIVVVDAHKLEGYTTTQIEFQKGVGYGLDAIPLIVDLVKPDFTLIYSSLDIVLPAMQIMSLHCLHKTKIIPYIDMVYEDEDYTAHLEMFKMAWGIAFFTCHWKDKFLSILKESDRDIRTFVIRHGVDEDKLYPVNVCMARKYFGIPTDAFVFGNFNRNNIRKRLDLTIQSFTRFLKRWYGDGAIGPLPILFFGQRGKGGWDLESIFKAETASMQVDDIMKHLKFSNRPQQYSDDEMNSMMQCADVGINTCVGEGWGLCNYEHAYLGYKQIVPDIGGFLEWGHESHTIKVAVDTAIYEAADEASNHTGVKVQMMIVNPLTVANTMYDFYMKGRAKVTTVGDLDAGTGFFSWKSIAKDFIDGLLAHM